MSKTEIYQKAIEKWGEKSQLEMLQEEATELALATRKFIRVPCDRTKFDLVGEIADVEIMIEQFKMMHPDIAEQLENKKRFKINRLSDRIKNNEYD